MEERKESHQLNIMPIGAGREVGRSCVIMECAGRQIMFDCGIHMNRQHRGKNALPYFEKIKPEELDLILITQYRYGLYCKASTWTIVGLSPTS